MNQTLHIDLQKENQELKKEIAYLKAELAQFKRFIFGKKSERYLSEEPPLPPNTLFTQTELEENKIENITQQITYEREKPTRKPGGRKELPSHLLREIEIIEPQDKNENDRIIGTLITEILEYTPGKMYVRHIERPKYINDTTQQIKVASIPSSPIPKSQFGPKLITQVAISKYIDHMPLYRQIQQYTREQNIKINRSSLGESLHQHIEILNPLYELHKKITLTQQYIQTDETTYKVQTETKKGKTHLGYIWASRSPEQNLVLFTYQKTRSGESMTAHLGNYKGKLQVDGYTTYETLQNTPGLTIINCWAHARRYFEQALKSDPTESHTILKLIQQLYAIERHCKENKTTHDQRQKIRQEQSKEILEKIKTNLDKLSTQAILPNSTLGTAIGYTLKRWKNLSNYIDHGEVEIDNNLLENSIRPIALGRKNYLFAGSHESAQHAAMIYSFFASCKLHDINPYDWLLDILLRIKDHHINKLDQLLPQNWSQHKS